jgi:hypothetical protein
VIDSGRLEVHEAGAIPKGTRVASKSALADLLARWYRETTEETIGPDVTFGGQEWVWVDLRPHPVKLNADTSREAVRAYLDDVSDRGLEVPWYVVANERGRVNKVLYRADGKHARGWYCYLAYEVAEPCEL